jgi:hypothetical protein
MSKWVLKKTDMMMSGFMWFGIRTNVNAMITLRDELLH